MDIRRRLVLIFAGAIAVAFVAVGSPARDAEAVLPVGAPTTGWVTQEFGGCSSDAYCHAAVDIAGPPSLPGNPVYAMADGVVIQRVQQSNGYGCHIVIDHGGQGDGRNLYSLYSHLGWKDAQGITQGCYFTVALGQWVARGQQIGNQGNSGLATGTHLHFTVLLYPPPWTGSHHAIDPRQCIGYAAQYTAHTPGPGCGAGTCPHDLADGCLLRALPSGRYVVYFGGARFSVPDEATRQALYGDRPAWDVSDYYLDTLELVPPRDGTLLLDSSNGKVYVIVGGARVHVPNEQILKTHYCPGYPQTQCSGRLWPAALASIPTTIPDGTLLHDPSNGSVHVIAGGARFHVPNEQVLEDVYCPGYPHTWCAATLWSAAISALPTSPRDRSLLHDVSNGKVYVTFGSARFHVPNEPTLQQLYCPSYPQPGCWTHLWHAAAEALPTTPVDDALLRQSGDPRVYAICGGGKWWIPSEQVFNSNGYQWNKVGLVWPGAITFADTPNTDTQVNAPGDRQCDFADVDDDNDALKDGEEQALWMTNHLTPDSDGDGRVDSADNCPRWANPTGALPGWAVIPIDADCDGFTSIAETRLGTDPVLQCAATPVPGDEPVDAWPADLNDDRRVDELDLSAFGTVLNKIAGSPGFSARHDINGDQRVDVADVTIVAGFVGKTCS